MFKHKFNIFPEMQGEEMARLVEDIKAHGFDKAQPVILFDGQILDGWNRHLAAETVGIEAAYKDFVGTDTDAVNFVMRTNKRRNLTSQQWAAIAADAGEIIEVIQAETERERREKQAKTLKETHEKGEFGACVNKLTQTKEETETPLDLTYEIETPFQPKPSKPKTANKNRAAAKTAQVFNTNRTYYTEAQKLKETAPEKFEALKRGETTFQQIKKEEKENAPEPVETVSANGTDDFTKLLARHSRKLMKTFEEFESAMNEVWADFKQHSRKFSDFAPIVDGFNRGYAPEKLVDLKNQADLLKRYVRCPNCAAAGCVWCKEKGYVHKSEVERIIGATR